jgi:hypothetical protein
MVDRSVTRSEARIRFKDFVLQELPNTQCLARVVLERRTGDEFVGHAEGENSPQGQLRSAAQATAQALEAATHGQVALTVLSVKALETLETILVVVSLSSHLDHRSERLVGSVLTKERAARAAALAVLNATNRLLSIYFR